MISINWLEKCQEEQFPSPTGVTYYEFINPYKRVIANWFPSPTGVTYYELLNNCEVVEDD